MNHFFNPENFLWKWFAHLADYFLLSCMWLIGSIPLVTVGTASIALYDTVAHCIRGAESDMFRRFLRTYKQELGRGIVLTLVWAVVAALLGGAYQVVSQSAGGSLIQAVCFFLLLLPMGVLCWAVAIESRFTYSVGALHRMSVIFTFAHLPHTAAIVALLVVELNVLINFPFFVIFLPGAVVTFQSWFIEKVFRKYTDAEEAEAIE